MRSIKYPAYKRSVGRPSKKARLKAQSELGFLTKNRLCSRCNTYGHNARTCKAIAPGLQTSTRMNSRYGKTYVGESISLFTKHVFPEKHDGELVDGNGEDDHDFVGLLDKLIPSTGSDQNNVSAENNIPVCNPVSQATTDDHHIRLPKPFEELTEEQRSTVNSFILDKNDLTKRVISTKSNNVITGVDLKEFKERQWLSDVIINHWMHLLNLTRKEISSDCLKYFCDSWYYPLIKQGKRRYSDLEDWLLQKNIVITEIDMLLLPIHHNENHWALACVRPKAYMIEIYDSIKNNHMETFHMIFSYIMFIMKSKDCKEEEEKWNFILKPCPKQLNTDDCGVHCLVNATIILHDGDVVYSSRDMTKFRQIIAWYILRDEPVK